MSAEIVNITGDTVTVRVTGKLLYDELKDVQQKATGIIEKQGDIRILFLLDLFEGWDKKGNWGDISFMEKHDVHIKKIAIVGDYKWRGLALVFSAKGMRKAPVEYFVGSHIKRAREWLAKDAPAD